LGQALHILGGYARAPGLIEGALAIFHEIGDRTYEAETLAYDGRLADSWGDYARARDRLDQALGLSRAVQAYEPMLDALVGLSLVSQHMGNHERALTYAEQAWEIAHAMGSRLRQAHVLGARGHALAGLRRPAEAVTAYQHALTLYAEIGVMAPLTSAAWAGLARIALGQGDLEQALAHVNAVLPVLAGQEPVGLEEPFEVYLTCYHVLAANHDQRAAEVLGRAQRQLHAYADDIADAALRQSFLEHVAIPDERAGPSSGFPPSSAANAA
jgi:tetratricopeptide (TPR) repeat protein